MAKAYEYDGVGNVVGVKPLQYQVIYGRRLESLEDQVVKLLNQGWKPLGGIVVSPEISGYAHSSNGGYYQAMIKEEK